MGEYHKERKIFNIGGFRGLDTENKPDKVEPFRATSGKNFIIENDSLKTRPSLVNEKIYSVDGNIIGSFLFFGDEIIFTEGDYQGKCRIYISNDNETYYSDGASRNSEHRIFTNLGGFLFNGTKPFFVQEKSCLFVFCINDIYVITKVAKDENYAYVIYQIDNKIPFETTDFSDYCSEELYSELPYAYVPTIQIGDKLFEDVNLLSNKRKYKLFNKDSDDLYNEYYLLGDYNPDKNGELSESDVNVEFYGKNINSIEKIPNFLGVQNELPIDYETETDAFYVFDFTTNQIKDGYTATEIWEFLDTDTDFENPISQVAGITKAKALKFIISNDSNEDITIFEYLQNIDLSSFSTAIGEKKAIFKFPIDIEAMYRIKNSSGEIVSSANKKIFTMYIYFGYYEIEPLRKWILLNSNYVVRPTVTSTTDSFPTSFVLRLPSFERNSINVDTFDNLPVEANVQEDTAYYCEDENDTLYLWSSTEQEFVQACIEYPNIVNRPYDAEHYLTIEQKKAYINWFNTNYTLPSDILEAQIRIKTRKVRTVYPLRTYSNLTLPAPLDEDHIAYGRDYAVSNLYNNWQGFSSSTYPTILGVLPDSPGSSNPVIVVEAVYSSESIPTRLKDGGWYVGISQATFSAINEYINDEHLTPGNYNLILHIGEIKTSGGVFQTGYKYSFHTTMTVNADADYSVYLYNLHILHLYRQSDAVNNLFELSYTEEGINAKVINYLINYKNEPAITITIGFANNSYNKNLIAKTKFGITFGSENRIFLAGNPDFQHIDRYNASNDLLGNNDKAQSYELSYFPSKNYRVVGSSSSAINGYVVATDNQLYVTKTRAVNDSCLYIRTRTLTDAGFASFYEYKTNINKTPLNNRCIVNFYNDVLMLTSEGLLAIEIASNILTNERLLKLRSGFINKELISAVKDTNVWCVEDNSYLYIVVGNNIYVADARYVAKNDQAKIENLSYEIVKWEVEPYLIFARMTDEGLVFYDLNRSYMLSDTGFDEKKVAFVSGDITFSGATVSINASIVDELTNDSEIVIEKKADSYCRIMALSPTELVAVDEGTDKKITFTQEHIDLIELRTGFEIEEIDIYAYFNAGESIVFQSIDLVNLTTFILDEATNFNGIFVDWYGKKLYVTKAVDNTITLKTSRRSDVNATILIDTESLFDKNYIYYIEKTPIEVEWKSGILDFGNKLYEKTMYSLSFYARVCETGNIFQYGYRTLRTHKDLTMLNNLPLANNLSFSDSNFNIFSLTTFENNVISKLQKENNFLYIQFIFKGEGNIEISDFVVYYKNNRKNKIVS